MQWISESIKEFKLHFLTRIGELIPKETRLGKSEVIMEARVGDTE